MVSYIYGLLSFFILIGSLSVFAESSAHIRGKDTVKRPSKITIIPSQLVIAVEENKKLPINCTLTDAPDSTSKVSANATSVLLTMLTTAQTLTADTQLPARIAFRQFAKELKHPEESLYATIHSQANTFKNHMAELAKLKSEMPDRLLEEFKLKLSYYKNPLKTYAFAIGEMTYKYTDAISWLNYDWYNKNPLVKEATRKRRELWPQMDKLYAIHKSLKNELLRLRSNKERAEVIKSQIRNLEVKQKLLEEKNYSNNDFLRVAENLSDDKLTKKEERLLLRRRKPEYVALINSFRKFQKTHPELGKLYDQREKFRRLSYQVLDWQEASFGGFEEDLKQNFLADQVMKFLEKNPRTRLVVLQNKKDGMILSAIPVELETEDDNVERPFVVIPVDGGSGIGFQSKKKLFRKIKSATGANVSRMLTHIDCSQFPKLGVDPGLVRKFMRDEIEQ